MIDGTLDRTLRIEQLFIDGVEITKYRRANIWQLSTKKILELFLHDVDYPEIYTIAGMSIKDNVMRIQTYL